VNARCRAVLAFALLAAPATAQRGVDPDEFVHLEPVLQQALAKAAPFVVAVETFGGTRRVLAADGPIDGDAPPRQRPAPKPKPLPGPQPKADPKPESDEPDAEPPKPVAPEPAPMPGPPPAPPENGKPKVALTAPGFQQTQGRTTGIVLTADGWVLVSRFALNLDPTTILVTVPGRGTFHAQRAGEDTSRGIALVKIDAEGLPVPELVHPDAVRVGQWAFALGRTFANDEPTVHIGIISAKRRQFGRALQVDAYTSPANYGGAVVDVQGRVLGIAVPLSPSGRNAGAEWYDSGIGFAATLADIQPLLARMQRGEVLQRGWLGVELETSHLGPGAKISGTPKDGVAAQSGLRKGDVLAKVDGVPVANGPHFQMLLSSRLGGDPVDLEVVKKSGETVSLRVTLAAAPWSEQQQKQGAEPAAFPLPEKDEGR
jgi:S1-C subfamily serine protease